MENTRIVFIFGPTGVGKTDLAVEVAEGIGEIISVDSMQVYKGLECGTSKPGSGHMKRVKHHLVSCVPPDFRFSAGDFKRLAGEAISGIFNRGKVPILVGGTGLYFRALEYNLIDAPQADLRLRESLYGEEVMKGVLYNKLSEIDPETAHILHPNDLVRIVRALEVYYLSGMKFSEYIKKGNRKRYNTLKIGINMNRDILYRRLELRCLKMTECGLAEEVYRLLKNGYTEKLPSMKGLGYGHFIQYLKGCHSHGETVRLFIRDTKRYAKRQLTWFRKEAETQWFKPEDHDLIREKIRRFVGF